MKKLAIIASAFALSGCAHEYAAYAEAHRARAQADVRGMPLNYVTREDYRVDVSEIKGMLGKVFDRLEHKADK